MHGYSVGRTAAIVDQSNSIGNQVACTYYTFVCSFAHHQVWHRDQIKAKVNSRDDIAWVQCNQAVIGMRCVIATGCCADQVSTRRTARLIANGWQTIGHTVGSGGHRKGVESVAVGGGCVDNSILCGGSDRMIADRGDIIGCGIAVAVTFDPKPIAKALNREC